MIQTDRFNISNLTIDNSLFVEESDKQKLFYDEGFYDLNSMTSRTRFQSKEPMTFLGNPFNVSLWKSNEKNWVTLTPLQDRTGHIKTNEYNEKIFMNNLALLMSEYGMPDFKTSDGLGYDFENGYILCSHMNMDEEQNATIHIVFQENTTN